MTKNKLFLAHSGGSGYYLYLMVCTISDVGITVEADIQLNNTGYLTYGISPVLLNENKLFIAHNNDNSKESYGISVSDFSTLAQTITSQADEINGVAETSATDGQMADIKVPDYIN